MAIYHLEAKVISRGSGRSAVAAAAYMSCSAITNDYDGVAHDYTRKHGLIWQHIFLTENAPQEWKDRSALWNAVEENEKTKDSRLAREFVAALPSELDEEKWKSLLSDFISEQFVADGMCADVSIHDTDGHNPHAHILLTVRPLTEEGKWQYKTEKEYVCVRNGEERGFTASEFRTAQNEGWEKQYQYKVGKKKVYMSPSQAEANGYERVSKHPKSTRYGRQNPVSERWNSEEQLLKWREAWADTVNRHLAANNIDERIDHRSFASRGITEQPTVHEGVAAQAMENRGITADRRELNRQIRADNSILRKLRLLVNKLVDSVENRIESFAETLESIFYGLVFLQYEFLVNNDKLESVKDVLKKEKPVLKEYNHVQKQIKEKTNERKNLQAEKNNCGALQIIKSHQLSAKITTLTEETEELKTRRTQLTEKLGCSDSKEVREEEKQIKNLEKYRDQLTEQQLHLMEQYDEQISRYDDIAAQISPDEISDVDKKRREIRNARKEETIKNLEKNHSFEFSYSTFDDAEKEVRRQKPDVQPKAFYEPKKSVREMLKNAKAEIDRQDKEKDVSKKKKIEVEI